MTNEEHHTSPTISCLSLIPNINIVDLFSMDYMHLVCLGVMRKLIFLWSSKGSINVRIPNWKSKQITTSLLSLKKYITNDFSRKPRPLEDVNRWKATEFRQFLLYTGIIVLKNVISEDCYQNFLALNISMKILLSDNHSKYLNYAQDLLKSFIKSFEEIYGTHFISHNIHGLQHLCDDYVKHGSLNNCSAFPFENYMKNLKKMIRKYEKPLQQIVHRYNESCKYVLVNNYDNANLLSFSIKEPNCFALTNEGEIIKILNISKTSITGKYFLNKEDLFIKPIKSSELDIFVVQTLSENLKSWDISNIEKKIIVFYFDNKYLAIPILHC